MLIEVFVEWALKKSFPAVAQQNEPGYIVEATVSEERCPDQSTADRHR
jgi:hypothetical protein